MPWKILKATEPLDAPPYSGPTCIVARVATGKIYKDKEAAQSDAAKLWNHNSIGFYVVECDESGKV